MTWSENLHQQLDDIVCRLDARAFRASVQREVQAKLQSSASLFKQVRGVTSPVPFTPETRG